jgi:dihydropteroate synthase type 2
MTSVFGILNVTRDSFSDGGMWLEPWAAIARGRELQAAGADVVDIGAESTHPEAEQVPAAVEIARLLPVVRALQAAGIPVSIDTSKPEVMVAMSQLGVAFLNDVTGFRSEAAVEAAAASQAKLVVMFARNAGPRAERRELPVEGLLEEIEAFFAHRLDAFARAGVARDRIVLDPGMGFFLGAGIEPSLCVLRNLPRLRRLGYPLLVSVSRKSFLGTITGRSVHERGAASLAAELFAAAQGADWIRTHDPMALRDGLRIASALRG